MQLLVLGQIIPSRSGGLHWGAEGLSGTWGWGPAELISSLLEVLGSSCYRMQVSYFVPPPPSAACKLPFGMLPTLLSISWTRALITCVPGLLEGFWQQCSLPSPLRAAGLPPPALPSSVPFVPSNHKGMREAESFVQVAHKARPPEVFKCGLEED